MAKVFYASARARKWRHSDSMPGKLERLLASRIKEDYFENGEWVAVKTHFGSEGAHRIVRPVFLRIIADAIKTAGAKPFITDTVRIKGLDYLEVANRNGINHLSVGAPVVLADGLYGNDSILIKAGEILNEVAVASAIHDATAMVVCSHVKGHINSGYAGAIKNLAMGGVSGRHRTCGWKCGRGSMHTLGEGLFEWDSEKCTFCGQCVEICPLDCIEFKNKKFTYNAEVCWRCGRCTRVCPEAALTFPGDDQLFLKSLPEAAKAVLSTFRPRKVLYINFLTEIQPECDCMPAADVPLVQDIGILVSADLVAVEMASIDMIRGQLPLPASLASDQNISAGQDILMTIHNKNYMITMEEAVKLGLGSEKYELVEI